MAILQETDFKTAVPVFNSISWNLLTSAIETAEESMLKKLLGTTEYANLVTASASLPYTGTTLDLYDKLKAPLAQYVAYVATPSLDVNLGTMGFTVHSTDDAKPASQARVHKFQLSQLRMAMAGFDRLLTWLEANKATYTDWAAGEAYTELKQGFVNTTAEFNAVVDINESRYLFLRLRPHRTKVEQYEVKSYLGEDLYNEIKAQIVADSVNADNLELLPIIHQIVANRAIAKGILALNLEVTEEGYLAAGIQESTTMNMAKRAPNEHINTLVVQHDKEADAFIEKLRKHLNAEASATKYAVYFNSNLYVDPDGSNPNEDRHENQGEDPVWFF